MIKKGKIVTIKDIDIYTYRPALFTRVLIQGIFHSNVSFLRATLNAFSLRYKKTFKTIPHYQQRTNIFLYKTISKGFSIRIKPSLNNNNMQTMRIQLYIYTISHEK